MRHPTIVGAAAAAVALLLLVGCRSWDQDRKDWVEPFNRSFHKDYPKALYLEDLDKVLAFYGPPLSADPALRRDKEALLGRFGLVDLSESIIDRIRLLDGPDRIGADLTVRLRGKDPAGARLSVFRSLQVVCERGPGGYRIVEEKVLSEEIGQGGAPRFTEESEARGIAFTHRSGGVLDRWGKVQNYPAGAGLGVGDFDGDGFDDICLVNGKEFRLLRNRGEGTFEDVSERTGAWKLPSGEGRCASFVDYDNDGRTDLFIGVLDGPDLLLHNDGEGRFIDRAAAAGLKGSGQTAGVCFADFNGDGWLDLYIINGGNVHREDPKPIYNALNATPNVLYLSNGDGTFRDRTKEAGVGHTGWALTVAAQDYDLDGRTDIFLGNDVGFSVLYRNRGDGTFEDVSRRMAITRRGSSLGAGWGDFNGDGLPDLFSASMASNTKWIFDIPSFPSPAPWWVNLFIRGPVMEVMKEMYKGNWVHINRGKEPFLECAAAWGTGNSGWPFGTAVFDYDNDGREDVYLVNGFISGPDPKDL